MMNNIRYYGFYLNTYNYLKTINIVVQKVKLVFLNIIKTKKKKSVNK